MTIHLVVGDAHAHPDFHNDRAIWLGELIRDVKPDTVIMMGDQADMPSLCSYDQGKKSFQGRSYAKDIHAHEDFEDKLWSTVRKSKRRMPRRVALLGNHEERIRRAIEVQPELEGTISYRDLRLEDWYDDIVDYDGGTPGIIEIDGVFYAHYLVSGIGGRPISSENQARALVFKGHVSCTVGHQHILDYCVLTRRDGQKLHGLCAGVYQDYDAGFAGQANRLWWRGVVVCRNVEKGNYDVQFVSLEALKREYEQ